MNLHELPGSELILPGIDDLHNGRINTVGSLLVAIAATRLTDILHLLNKGRVGTAHLTKLSGFWALIFAIKAWCKI